MPVKDVMAMACMINLTDKRALAAHIGTSDDEKLLLAFDKSDVVRYEVHIRLRLDTRVTRCNQSNSAFAYASGEMIFRGKSFAG